MCYLKVYLINSSYLIETDGSPCRPRSLEAEPRGAEAREWHALCKHPASMFKKTSRIS